MSEAENVAVMKAIFAGAHAGDWPAVEALMHDDFVIVEAASMPYPGEFRGKDALQRVLGIVRDTWADLKITPQGMISGGDLVVVSVQLSGRSVRTGEAFDMPLLERWRVRDGKAVEVWPFYFDTGLLARIA